MTKNLYQTYVKDQKLIDFKGKLIEYESNNEEKVSSKEKIKKDQLLLLENKMTEVISRLSIEKDLKKKKQYDEEYSILVNQIDSIKKNND